MSNSDWSLYIISELEKAKLLKIEDGNHGEYRPRSHEFTEQGTSFIRAADINQGRILFESASRINDTALSRIRKGIGCPGDTLLSSKGTVGKIALASLNCEPFVCSPQVTFWRSLNNNFLYYRFLYYYIHSSAFFTQIKSISGESDMAPYISLTNQRKFKIAIPNIDEQKAIAHILGTLDDKIELNQKMNQTLEEIARAIFKSWFVDFDPVRAKMEGKQPVGMDTATANLFPESFEESALGLIPRGWRVGTLSELAKINSGKRPKERSSIATSEMNIPLYGGGGIMAYVKEPLYNYPILATGRVGTLGIVFRISKSCWTSDNTLVILSKNQEFYEYLYFQLKDIDVISLNRGSTQPLVTQSDLKNQEFVIPSQELLKEFHFLTLSLFNKLDANIGQSETLANIRDTLLPKLMSGEIRVKEAERMIEEVV
jgi:type I restriction enzyme, S subunit